MEKKITKPTKLVDKNDHIGKSSEDNSLPNETGGPKGLEPTRYGDWEKPVKEWNTFVDDKALWLNHFYLLWFAYEKLQSHFHLLSISYKS